MVCVSWSEAREFCAWLSKKDGLTYRLPTDDEWSAAVGKDKYPWGNVSPPPKGAGNFGDRSFVNSVGGKRDVHDLKDYDDGAARTAPVASYRANRIGIFDLGSNVQELCEDEYDGSLNDPDVLQVSPGLKLKKGGKVAFRVVRGCSWYTNYPPMMRSSYRMPVAEGDRNDIIGFRCALVISGG